MENAQLECIQQKLDALQQTVILMLEDKTAREAENRLWNEERAQLEAEFNRLTDAVLSWTTNASGGHLNLSSLFRKNEIITVRRHSLPHMAHPGE